MGIMKARGRKGTERGVDVGSASTADFLSMARCKVSEEAKGNLPNPDVTYCILHWLYSNSILVKR